jgi:hypothetical protein
MTSKTKHGATSSAAAPPQQGGSRAAAFHDAVTALPPAALAANAESRHDMRRAAGPSACVIAAVCDAMLASSAPIAKLDLLRERMSATARIAGITKNSAEARSLANNWLAVAREMRTLTDRVDVLGKEYTKQQCVLEALAFSNYFGDAWLVLSHTLPIGAKLVVRDVEHTKQTSLLEANRCAPGNPDIWIALGDEAVRTGKPMKMNGRKYDAPGLFAEVLRGHSQCAPAWMKAGTSLPPNEVLLVGPARYSPQQCFLRSLTIDEKSGPCWMALGGTVAGSDVNVVIGNSRYSQQSCYLEALKYVPDSSAPWIAVGCTLAAGDTVFCRGHRYTQHECFHQACKVSAPSADAWFKLAMTIPQVGAAVVIRARSYTRLQCLVEAVAMPEYADDANVWSSIENAQSVDRPVVVNGVTMSKRQVCARALSLDPQLIRLWLDLTMLTPKGQTTAVGGQECTQQMCFDEFISRSGADEPDVWMSVASLDETGASEFFSAKECYRKVLGFDLARGDAWRGLAAALKDGEVIDVGDNVYTRLECAARAEGAADAAAASAKLLESKPRPVDMMD